MANNAVPPVELRIRPALQSDAANLAALALQVWLHNYAREGISSIISEYVLNEFTEEKFRARIDNAVTTFFLGEVITNRVTNLVGFARLDVQSVCPVPAGSAVQLSTLYVQEPFVHRGVGTALLAHAETGAGSQGAPQLWLTVNAQNHRALAFYAKHRYQKIGVTPFRLGDIDHENHVLIGGGP